MDMTPSWQQTARVIVFSILLGGTSGVLTAAITSGYLSEYTRQLEELTEPLRQVQERPRAEPSTYESALTTVREDALPAMGGVYAQGVVVSVDAARAAAVAMTSDGWLLSRDVELGDTVRIGSETCTVVSRVVEPLSGLMFARCEGVTFSVVDFGHGNTLAPGDQVFVAGDGEVLTFTRIRAVSYGGEIVRSSDVPARRLVLEGSSLSNGSVVFNVLGEIVGVIQGDGVVPMEQLTSALENVLDGAETLESAALGITALDTPRTVGSDKEVQGALVEDVIGAAAEAGIMVGDTIISVDGLRVGAEHALDDIVASLRPGDRVRVQLERVDKEIDVDVTLGTYIP